MKWIAYMMHRLTGEGKRLAELEEKVALLTRRVVTLELDIKVLASSTDELQDRVTNLEETK